METDVLRLGRQRFGKQDAHQEIGVNHANLKLGLSPGMDMQLVVESYTVQTERGEHAGGRAGFGDLTLRLKRNLWGNDSGYSALAIMPFIKVPTGRNCGNRAWEGGVVVPYARQLPHDWTFGSQLQTTLVRDSGSGQNCVELAPTLTMGHDLYKTLGGFMEVAGAWDLREKNWAATLNGGPIWRVTDNLQLDLGLNFPLTRDTETTYFLGVSVRR